jgi:hypothetical protein
MPGSDAIMAAQEMWNVIMAPTVLFGATKDIALANSIFRNFSQTMAPLINAVESILKESPGITEAASRIGNTVFDGLVTITSAKPGPHQKFLILFTLSVKTSGLKQLGLQKHAAWDTRLPPHQSCSFALDDISAPYWGMLGLIFRMALNELCHLEAEDSNIFNLLCGIHATQGANATLRNCNQFDLLHAHFYYAQFTAKHLHPMELTQPHGLSNPLVWMGSGQSALTTVFLDKYGACSKNPTECISKFHQAAVCNSHLEGFSTFKFEPLSSHLDHGFIPFDNISIWRMQCKQLWILDYKAEGGTSAILAEFS